MEYNLNCLLKFTYPFQVEDFIKEEIETHLMHTTRIVWKFIKQQVAVSLFKKLVIFWMPSRSLFQEVCLSPMRSFHQIVISPENSCQRSLLELFHPF